MLDLREPYYESDYLFSFVWSNVDIVHIPLENINLK